MILFLLLVPAILDAHSQELADLLTEHRAQSNLQVPMRSEMLDAEAIAHAQKLAAWGRLAHIDPQGRKAEHRVAVLGLGKAGEVLGYGPSASEIFQAWLESPGHRRVLETVDWTRYGVGTASWGGGFVAVMLFWAP